MHLHNDASVWRPLHYVGICCGGMLHGNTLGSALHGARGMRQKAQHPPTQALPDAEFDLLARFQGQLRALPLAAGAAGIAGTLLNRVLSGVSAQLTHIRASHN